MSGEDDIMIDTPRPKKKRWWLRILIALAILFGICQIPLGRVKIEIGHDTTRINGPLNADGTVNYLAALENEYTQWVSALQCSPEQE